MNLSKKKISKLLKSNNQSKKIYLRSRPINKNSFRKKKPFNLRTKTLKNISGGKGIKQKKLTPKQKKQKQQKNLQNKKRNLEKKKNKLNTTPKANVPSTNPPIKSTSTIKSTPTAIVPSTKSPIKSTIKSTSTTKPMPPMNNTACKITQSDRNMKCPYTKSEYRKKVAMRLHPDKNPDCKKEAEELFKKYQNKCIYDANGNIIENKIVSKKSNTTEKTAPIEKKTLTITQPAPVLGTNNQTKNQNIKPKTEGVQTKPEPPKPEPPKPEQSKLQKCFKNKPTVITKNTPCPLKKSNYRKNIALILHPDKNPDCKKEAEELFKTFENKCEYNIAGNLKQKFTQQSRPEQPRPEQSRPEQPRPEQPIPEQPIPEQPTPEQPTPEQSRPEQPTPEQSRPEQPTTEQPTTEQPTTEQSRPEQPTTEQPIPEQSRPEEKYTSNDVSTKIEHNENDQYKMVNVKVFIPKNSIAQVSGNPQHSAVQALQVLAQQQPIMKPSEPVPVEPVPSEPAPIEPVPIEPPPVEPIPIEPPPVEPTKSGDTSFLPAVAAATF